MEKLTKYNQRILAIIGTIIIVGFALVLIVGLGALIVSLFNNSIDRDAGLQIRGEEKSAKAEVLRTQQMSFEEPIQLDSSQSIFLIPVKLVNLESEERVSLISEGSSDYGKTFRYDSRFDSYDGLFNNFILFDYGLGSSAKVFNKKVALKNLSNVKIKGTELLLFAGTENDSNKNNVLDSDDYQNIYAYFLKDRKLIAYKIPQRTVLGYGPMENTNLISISLGIDKNKDFKFDRKTEPQEVVALNVETRRIEHLISPTLKADIQNLIDK